MAGSLIALMLFTNFLGSIVGGRVGHGSEGREEGSWTWSLRDHVR